jgi:hypothetical protein
MAGKSVRTKPETHAKLQALARGSGDSLPELLEKAVEAYRRKQFLAERNRAYETLKCDPGTWARELKEREEWDCTLLDGVDDHES